MSNLTAIDRKQWEVNLTRGIAYRHGSEWHNENAENIRGLLKDFNFFRIHNSYIINLKYLKGVVAKETYFAKLVNDIQISISRRRKDEFFKFLDFFEFLEFLEFINSFNSLNILISINLSIILILMIFYHFLNVIRIIIY